VFTGWGELVGVAGRVGMMEVEGVGFRLLLVMTGWIGVEHLA